MKKAYIWVGIWAIIILAPILIIFTAYEPATEQKEDIVKIGVILPFMASVTASSTRSEEQQVIAEGVRNALELLPKRPLAAGLPPSIVYIYEDSEGDEARVLQLAGKLANEAKVSAIISAPISTSTHSALTRQLRKADVPLISFGDELIFSCEKEGLNNVGMGEVAALAVFCKTYQTAYTQIPGYYAAYAYDVGNILMRALEIQRSDIETKKTIRRAFNSRVYKGITGTINF